MNNAIKRRGFALATAATAMFFATAPHAFADAMTLTNIAGREVTLRPQVLATLRTPTWESFRVDKRKWCRFVRR